jgi:hypothetical protein
MISRIGSGFDVSAIARARQVESAPAARNSSEARQAGAQAAAAVRIGAEGRARAAASAAEARAAAAAPRERPELEELTRAAARLPDVQSLRPFADVASPHVSTEELRERLARAQLEQ